MTGNPRPVIPCKQGIKGRRLEPFVAQFITAMIAAFDWVVTEKNRAQGINKVKQGVHRATFMDTPTRPNCVVPVSYVVDA